MTLVANWNFMVFDVSVVTVTQMSKLDSVLIGGTPSVTSFQAIRAYNQAQRIGLNRKTRTNLIMKMIYFLSECDDIPDRQAYCMSFAKPLDL